MSDTLDRLDRLVVEFAKALIYREHAQGQSQFGLTAKVEAARAAIIAHAARLEQEKADQQREMERLRAINGVKYEETYKDFIGQRGVREACKECAGLGTKVYGSTSTWRGGIGGAAMTTDVCNICWGSGDANRPWLNLRENERALAELPSAIAWRLELGEGQEVVIADIIQHQLKIALLKQEAAKP